MPDKWNINEKEIFEYENQEEYFSGSDNNFKGSHFIKKQVNDLASIQNIAKNGGTEIDDLVMST